MVLAAIGPWWDNPEVWVGVAFAILLGFALKQGAAGAITKALDDRADGIRRDIEEARKLRDEAQALLDESKRKHAAATEEAATIVAGAKAEAEHLAAVTRRALKESVERRTKLAEEKIARAEAQAIAEVRSTSVDIAMSAAENLIAGKSSATSGSLIDQSIRDLKGRMN